MARRTKHARAVSLIALLWLLNSGAGASSAESGFAAKAAPLVRKYCADCHGSELAEAGVNLEQMAATPQFGSRFKTWGKVLDMLRQRKMPPEGMPQPGDAERLGIVEAIQHELDSFIRNNAGDPGPVVMRRLTSAEYAWTIRDLTDLDLPLERDLVEDAVGGEGFANVGHVQFMQDSVLERYLAAARTVAAHAVIGSGPLDFFEDPGQTGLELSAIGRIQRIYRRHGFRTGAGEGAEPFGLDMYPRGFYVAWQHRHRDALGRGDASLAGLADAEGISVRFAAYIWTVLNEPAASFPTSAISDKWRALPAPGGDRQQLNESVRDGCDDLYRLMRDWQRLLAAATDDEEEVAVLTGDGLHVSSRHRFEADLDWPEGAKTATLELSVTPANTEGASRSIVVFRNPRIRFRGERRRWSDERPLSSVLSRRTRERLAFGRSPQGAELDPRDFAIAAPAEVSIDFDVPESATRAELLVGVELDLHGGGAPVRCTISDGAIEGETAAESGGYSALLADPEAASYARWEQGVLEFARHFPEVSQREPAPSDRDPIPAPFDNTYNSTERNLFHSRIKYHRDDDFLVKHILDDATRLSLDQAWTDLLSSFEYHDLFLHFVADKYDLDLQVQGIAELEPGGIAGLPEEPRRFVERLYESYSSTQERLQAAQPGQAADALRFAERAWRRPLAEGEQTRLLAFYSDLRQNDRVDHTDAVRALVARILLAPAFLYRVEPPAEQRGVVPLSDWELASRLSYFLWSSIPDLELRQAAEAGRLQNPEELTRQARRMLRDPKARRFATEFFGQWFGFYRFDTYQGIDATRFPELTSSLKAAMYDEAVSFFEHIVREDRPVGEILFADYTFLNRLLARHYGIDPAEIDPDNAPADRPLLASGVSQHRRGGLLRLGAVLTVTSAPLRTSPVKRGDWILRRVLGTPVPPPPADAGSIPPDDVLADGRTVRERLEAHRREASCVNCHSRMDPLGFALEHFDAVGRWRDQYRDGTAIDAAGTLHDGTRISGPDGLHQYLREQELQFQRTLCSKLLGYALGRSEIASDRPLVEQMLASLDDESGLSRLVVQVVTSRQFRYQRGSLSQPPAAIKD